MIVVKVGGSLFDHPNLGPGLREFLAELDPPVLLVPGGGEVADAVRTLDRVHGLGEEQSHWIALRSLAVTGGLLQTLTLNSGPTPRLGHLRGHGCVGPLADAVRVLDCYQFALDDPSLPHTWDVTTDSIAARAAVAFEASRLILLKSTDIPDGVTWEDAAANGWVDAHFPSVVAGAAFAVEAVNFRRRLDARRSG